MKTTKLMKTFFVSVLAIIAGGLFNSFIAFVGGGVGAFFIATTIGGLTDYNGVIKGLREQLAGKQAEMRALIATAEGENRDFNDDEDKEYKQFEAESRKIQARIQRLEEAEKLSAKDAGNEKRKNEKEQSEERKQAYETAFRHWLIFGEKRMTDEQREVLEEMRALNTGTDAEGGFTVPTGFAGRIEEALKTYGNIMEVSDVLQTATGNDIHYPTVNDTNNEGEILGENTDAGDSVEPVFGNVILKAHTYSSKPVLISNQLLQDNAVNLDQRIANMLVTRVMKHFNRHAITGNGTSQPQGVTVGPKGADAPVDAITYDSLVDLLHSVDEEYRKNGIFMLHDNTLREIKKLRDDDGRLIFQQSLRDGEPSTILGKPFRINNFLPEIGASNKSVAFGDFKKYMVRQVSAYQVKRLEERYAEKNQTGFLLFMRLDGKVIDAGTNPIKFLQHAAS